VSRLPHRKKADRSEGRPVIARPPQLATSGTRVNLLIFRIATDSDPVRRLLGGRHGHHNSSDHHNHSVACRRRRLVRPGTLVLGRRPCFLLSTAHSHGSGWQVTDNDAREIVTVLPFPALADKGRLRARNIIFDQVSFTGAKRCG